MQQSKKPIFIWVLAPQLQTEDANLEYYYDYTQSYAEYAKAFALLGFSWQWQPVTHFSYRQIITEIAAQKNTHTPIVFNLCDGDEINGTPGVSVIKLLEEMKLIYTGADEYFYGTTTSKIDMKAAFDLAGIPTPIWQIVEENQNNFDDFFQKMGTPLIVKPAISGGSMGVGINSVVHTPAALQAQLAVLKNGYRGWDLSSGGIIAERFINGPEFTVFISGSYHLPSHCHIYQPVQRLFHPSLPDTEKFLSFDRLWEMYETENAMPNQAYFYEYGIPDKALIAQIKKISWDAYCAVQGKGYTRVDVRMDQQTGQLYVLEVNAQCGISEDEDYTSIGAILRLDNGTFTQLIVEIINDALLRNGL